MVEPIELPILTVMQNIFQKKSKFLGKGLIKNVFKFWENGVQSWGGIGAELFLFCRWRRLKSNSIGPQASQLSIPSTFAWVTELHLYRSLQDRVVWLPSQRELERPGPMKDELKTQDVDPDLLSTLASVAILTDNFTIWALVQLIRRFWKCSCDLFRNGCGGE